MKKITELLIVLICRQKNKNLIVNLTWTVHPTQNSLHNTIAPLLIKYTFFY
jgi:hypothetical protein